MKIKDAILNKIRQTQRGTYIMVLAHIRYPEQSNPYKENAASYTLQGSTRGWLLCLMQTGSFWDIKLFCTWTVGIVYTVI